MTEPCDPVPALLKHVEGGTLRVDSVKLNGQIYWIKRPETLSTRMRLQKGSPRAAFERERVALRNLNKLGAPVPKLIVDRPDVIVTEHCGTNLRIPTHKRKNFDLVQLFFEAGCTLARFHGFGHAHGRPALKDMCWKDGVITIIDLERASPSLNNSRGLARDVVLMVINALAVMRGPCPEVTALLDGYKQADASGVWDGALRWSRNLTWMSLATRPLHILPLPIREIRTLPVARDVFRELRQ